MSMFLKEVKKIFLIGDKDHGDDPNIFDETMSDIDFKIWLDAMKSKIDLMYSNKYGI